MAVAMSGSSEIMKRPMQSKRHWCDACCGPHTDGDQANTEMLKRDWPQPLIALLLEAAWHSCDCSCRRQRGRSLTALATKGRARLCDCKPPDAAMAQLINKPGFRR